MKPRLFVAILALACVATAQAEVVATCGESQGQVYFPPNSHGKDFNGWHNDGFSGGSFQLIRSGTAYDVVFSDAVGNANSIKADSVGLQSWHDADGNVFVVARYPERVETFVFWLSRSKSPVASFSIARAGDLLDKHGLYVAPCRRGP